MIDRTPEDRDLIFASILGFSSGVNALSEEAAILKVGVLREEIKRCFIAWNEANKVVTHDH